MLYIHIPFCHRKCTYCAFYSVVTSADKQPYVDALCRELALRSQQSCGRERTVYFGGGTPSLLTLQQLGQIVDCLKQHYDCSSLDEATLEANPEDLTPQYLQGVKALHFFNRLSIGVQSFHDEELRMLNRRHNARQALQAIANAAEAGFDNLSIDLIYGLPGQSVEFWRYNLAQVAELPIRHLSAYALTVEQGTMLHRQVEQRRVVPATEDTLLAHYHALRQWAVDNGFEQYEISSFCRPGWRSQHNSHYWDRTPYIGIGAAAHSFDGQCRRWNVADVKQYIAAVAEGVIPHEQEQLTERDAYNEYLMTALRTVEGIDKSKLPHSMLGPLAMQIGRYIQLGWIEDTPTHYRPTAEGLLHADGMAADLFSD